MMKVTKYNKLVRDNIPDIIESSGRQHVSRQIHGEDLKTYLLSKLTEEINEFKETPCIEEMADILEVLEGLSKYYEFDVDAVKTAKASKRHSRGGFEKGIVLEEVIEYVEE